MAESACLMHTFSLASDTPLEAKEGNPIDALGESISFGRFMSESLAWERWSSFNSNRYLEEVEKYSKPGSVAQKKAYFEAHYKKIAEKKAAALLEQEDDSESEINNELCQSGSVGLGSHVSHNQISNDKSGKAEVSAVDADPLSDAKGYNSNEEPGGMGIKAVKEALVLENTDHVDNSRHIKPTNLPADVDNKVMSEVEADLVSDAKDYNSNEEPGGMETNAPLEVPVLENSVHLDNLKHIDSPHLCEDVENSMTTEVETSTMKQSEKLPLKESYVENQVLSASTTKRKLTASHSKSSVQSRAAKILSSPARPRTPAHSHKENNSILDSKKTAKDPADKRRLSPKSIHMSLNFAPSPSRAGETKKIATPLLQKTMDSKVSLCSNKISKDSSAAPTRTLTKESANNMPKLRPVTPQRGSKRTKPLLEHTATGSRKTDLKSQSLSIDHSKSSSSCGNKAWPPSVSSSFILRSEERAAKRKEYFRKLEEESNAREAQKLELQAKSQEKAETELRKLRQNLGFKAKPMPDFTREPPPSNNQKPLTRPRSPRLGRKPSSSTMSDTSSLPPRTPSVKSDVSAKHGTDKSKRTTVRSITSLPKKNPHENASPNLQS